MLNVLNKNNEVKVLAQKFDSSIRDSQGTHVEPINVENFDLDEYAEYEESLLERRR